MNVLRNKYIEILLCLAVLGIFNILIFKGLNIRPNKAIVLEYTIQADVQDDYQVFFDSGLGWREDCSISKEYTSPNKEEVLVYTLPKNTKRIRFDIGTKEGQSTISKLSISYFGKSIVLDNNIFKTELECSDIGDLEVVDNTIHITKTGEDPWFVLNDTQLQLESLFKIDIYIMYFFKIIGCIVVNTLGAILIKKRMAIVGILKGFYDNRRLIWNLSSNDFKTKYAGSYLGIVWAFIQPIITILVYWFVFQIGFRSAPVEDFPYVLWLIMGLVPWFFFSEALVNATNSMIEYSYLVKKIVFKISILPVVKIISSLFVHMFFVAFMMIVYMGYGYKLDMYALQIIYYSVCVFLLVLAIAYGSSAIVIFLKDLGQFINIFMQVAMWMTPIMWSYTMLPEKYRFILILNPMYYIVEGYRDALINKIWFWEKTEQTFFFWVLVIVLFGIGGILFKKLKPHFADVL